MRILVCGSRNYDPLKVEDYLDEYFRYRITPTVVIEGGAAGADCGGRHFGVNREIPVLTFPADWKTHGKRAGPIRNAEMLRDGKPDLVFAFLFTVGVREITAGLSDSQFNRGTKNMIKQAETAGVTVIIIEG